MCLVHHFLTAYTCNVHVINYRVEMFQSVQVYYFLNVLDQCPQYSCKLNCMYFDDLHCMTGNIKSQQARYTVTTVSQLVKKL